MSGPRIGSLCSGYGGLDLGMQAVLGGSVAWHVEYDAAPSKILAHHWPDVPNYGDVKHTDWSQVEPVDILTAGYPCQPFSHAGKRKGTDDPRHLWPDVARAIGALRPRLVVLENVRGHVSLGLDAVIGDLCELGYDSRWLVVRAADAGAPHGRARIFIAAHPSGAGLEIADGVPRGLPAALTPADRTPTPDAGGQRHGRGQDGRGLGRLDGANAGPSRERERSRGVTVDRGAETAADADCGRCDGCEECDSPTPGELAAPRGNDTAGRVLDRWGAYGPAIHRWESILGRPAPDPTEPGRNGRPRLSPVFVEWLMGLDPGHVTDPAIGLTRNQQLKALGNGVVPQQAALALTLLLGMEAVA